MRKIYKIILCWIAPGLVASVWLPVSGCFSLAGRMGSAWGGSGPSAGEKVFLGALDVVTFPIQLVVFGPPLLADYINSNTGENGRRKQEMELHRKAVADYRGLLDKDFGIVYMNPDFQCPTNRAAMEALQEWSRSYGSKVPIDKIRPYADILLKSPDLFKCQSGFWHLQAFTPEDRRQAFHVAWRLHQSEGDGASRQLVHQLIGMSDFTDGELESLRAQDDSPREALVQIVSKELERRQMRRRLEQERKESEFKAQEALRVLRQVEAENRRRAAEERQRKWKEHRENMRSVVQSLEVGGASFHSSLVWCRDEYVADVWQSRLYRKNPLPVENLRLLAEEVLKPGGTYVAYVHGLMGRTEFSADDLRRYYGLLLARIRDDGWLDAPMSRLIRNPSTPEDVVKLSYREPALVSLRYTYLIHRLCSEIPRDEFRQLERRHTALMNDGKLSRAKRDERLDREIRRYMPKDCPADWQQFLP